MQTMRSNGLRLGVYSLHAEFIYQNFNHWLLLAQKNSLYRSVSRHYASKTAKMIKGNVDQHRPITLADVNAELVIYITYQQNMFFVCEFQQPLYCQLVLLRWRRFEHPLRRLRAHCTVNRWRILKFKFHNLTFMLLVRGHSLILSRFFQHFLPLPSLPVTKCHTKLPST